MAIHTDPPKAPDAKPGVKPVAKDDLQKLPLAEVEKRLGSSPDGLTEAEAKKRLAQYGPNEIAEKKTNALLKFLGYFWGPIPWMIEVAVVLSAVVRHWPDFFIILVLLLANATIGFWEEREAGNAIDALKARLAIKARVKRDGKWITPPAKELVPGDAIRLRLGDIVPADARLLDGDEISVDQSALTGESLPATRKSGDAVFSGSIIRRGEIDALVYATGGKTYFGRDRGTGRDGCHRQPFPEGRAEDRRLSHRSGVDHGGRHRRSLDLSRRSDSHHAAIRACPDRGRHSRGDADRPVGDDGGGRAQAREETGDRQQAGRDRGTGRRRRALRRQDGHADAEQADARGAVLPGRDQR